MRPWLLCAVVASGCRTVEVTPSAVLAQLHSQPDGHVQGTPVQLGAPVVLNAEDFVYDARLSPDAKSVALARLGLKGYFLSVYSLRPQPPTRLADVAINAYEFDVEMLDFSPDGALVATVSRDGAVRLFDAATGRAVAGWLTDEPLVSLGMHPSGRWLAVGSARGLITVLALPSLTHVAELRGHADEVRGLAFAPDGTLFSAGWDKRLVTWSLDETSAPSSSIRAHADKKSGLLIFRTVLNGQASANVTVDARLPMTVVQGSLAQSAGIEVTALSQTTTISTAYGPQIAKVAQGQRLSFKGLTFEHVEVAVCDACLPSPAVQAVLGASLLERLTFATDDATNEVVLTAHPKAATVSQGGLTLRPTATVTFEAFINDLSIDARGQTLGVALSSSKALRTREIYEREKRNEPAPANPWDCGAFVDARTGEVLEKHGPHGTGIVATAGISPDGQSLVLGAWDNHLVLASRGRKAAIETKRLGWSPRRVRYSRDGRWLVVAAWTPQNPLGDHQSAPAAVVYEVIYGADAKVIRSPSH